ncbi:MAG TPA: hypothetical protein VGO00_16265 [Kofleriaceae bacterium]|jgi:hypothetical protein|nr:hypothetical protein [Kofleriaceae bacterium]
MRSLVVVALCVGVAAATPLPPGFKIWPSSISPDRKLGVIVPDVDHLKDNQRQNQLVDIATGKVIATLAADTVFEHQNNTDIKPSWSKDGTLLEWMAEGKWGSLVLVLVRVDHGAVKDQIDVREAAVTAVLAAANKANPKAYAAAKKEGAGEGSWFRDGFAIDVRQDHEGAPSLPFKIVIELTSNPKELDDYPVAARLKGTMTGTVGVDGKLGFGPFVVAK